MDRRSFLGSILAACAAPAIVRADSLMRVIPRETSVLRAAEYTWRQEALVVVPLQGTFLEIVSEAMKLHRDEIAANIKARNVLLRQAIKRGQLSSKAWGEIE